MARVPNYRLHKPSGQAVVSLAGKDHYLGVHGTPASKTLYRRLLAEYIASGSSKSFGQPVSELSIAEIMLDYLRSFKEHYGHRADAELARFKLASRPVRKLYGDTLASQFGPIQFKAIRENLTNEKNLNDGKIRSRTYINEMMRRILAMFKWAASESKLNANVYETLRLIPSLKAGRSRATDTEKIKPVSDAVVDCTLPKLPPVVADMVRLQRLTGARAGEICGLTPGIIDRSNEVWKAELIEHKTAHHGKSRTIYFGPLAQNILRPYLLRGANEYLFQPRDSEKKRRALASENRTTPMSCGNKPGSNKKRSPERRPGKQYSVASYRRAIARACDVHGIEHWHPHQLRHTAATKFRKAYGVEAAQVLLGHSDLSTTEIYAEADQNKALAIVRKIG